MGTKRMDSEGRSTWFTGFVQPLWAYFPADYWIQPPSATSLSYLDLISVENHHPWAHHPTIILLLGHRHNRIWKIQANIPQVLYQPEKPIGPRVIFRRISIISQSIYSPSKKRFDRMPTDSEMTVEGIHTQDYLRSYVLPGKFRIGIQHFTFPGWKVAVILRAWEWAVWSKLAQRHLHECQFPQTDKVLDFGNQCLLIYYFMKYLHLLFQFIFYLKKCSHWHQRSSQLGIYKTTLMGMLWPGVHSVLSTKNMVISVTIEEVHSQCFIASRVISFTQTLSNFTPRWPTQIGGGVNARHVLPTTTTVASTKSNILASVHRKDTSKWQ